MPVPDPEPLRCGDCKMPLEPAAGASPEACRPGPDDYCPSCARSGVRSIRCPHCGSAVCRACGTIVESAEDLGFG